MVVEGDAVDLLALFAEVEAEHAAAMATPEGRARFEAAEEAERLRMTPREERPDRCGKCYGSGHLPHFRHVAGGNCFDCGGSGLRGGHL